MLNKYFFYNAWQLSDSELQELNDEVFPSVFSFSLEEIALNGNHKINHYKIINYFT